MGWDSVELILGVEEVFSIEACASPTTGIRG